VVFEIVIPCDANDKRANDVTLPKGVIFSPAQAGEKDVLVCFCQWHVAVTQVIQMPRNAVAPGPPLHQPDTVELLDLSPNGNSGGQDMPVVRIRCREDILEDISTQGNAPVSPNRGC
jgi:hypothetical protein